MPKSADPLKGDGPLFRVMLQRRLPESGPGCPRQKPMTSRRQDEIAGMQTGNGSILQQDRVGAVQIKVDQQIAAAVHGGDMTGKPRAETIGVARSECEVVKLDIVLTRDEVADGIVTDAARSRLVEDEGVVVAVAEEDVVVRVTVSVSLKCDPDRLAMLVSVSSPAPWVSCWTVIARSTETPAVACS